MVLKFFANKVWFHLPGELQKKCSQLFSIFFKTKFSRFIILPYCFLFGLDSDYLDQFEPESQKSHYSSYSDFFLRKYKSVPHPLAQQVWPCEGYVCDWGTFQEKNDSVVKGQKINLNQIFASDESQTKNHFFINIFLHNHNYHRVHSPVRGIIQNITHIPGDLVFLRPWFYRQQDVSYPAFRNERVVIEIVDAQNKSWFLAMVGGFGVGTIELPKQIAKGEFVNAGSELGWFRLGSTVCLAIPDKATSLQYLDRVNAFDKMKISQPSSRSFVDKTIVRGPAELDS